MKLKKEDSQTLGSVILLSLLIFPILIVLAYYFILSRGGPKARISVAENNMYNNSKDILKSK